MQDSKSAITIRCVNYFKCKRKSFFFLFLIVEGENDMVELAHEIKGGEMFCKVKIFESLLYTIFVNYSWETVVKKSGEEVSLSSFACFTRPINFQFVRKYFTCLYWFFPFDITLLFFQRKRTRKLLIYFQY